jgi:hypothetical protein
MLAERQNGRADLAARSEREKNVLRVTESARREIANQNLGFRDGDGD